MNVERYILISCCGNRSATGVRSSQRDFLYPVNESLGSFVVQASMDFMVTLIIYDHAGKAAGLRGRPLSSLLP